MLRCVINNVDYVMTNKFKIQEKLGNVISSSIEILVPRGTRIPRAYDIVRVLDSNDVVHFTGVAGIPASPNFNSGNEVPIYKIKCQNANAILKRRLANYAENNATVTEIVNALFDLYVSDEGVTKGVVSDIQTNFEAYVAPNIDVQKVFNELAEQSNSVWEIDNNLVFNFRKKEEFPRFSRTIDEDYVFGNNLKHKSTGLDLRTVQIIEGATDETDQQTESFVYNGDSNDFTVGFPVIRKPVIRVNNTVVATDRIGVKGLNDNDNNIYFLFAFNSQVITYNEQSNFMPTDPPASYNVEIDYFGVFPIRIEVRNKSRIDEIHRNTGTSGVIENVINDSSLKNSRDGENRALSLLENFEMERDEIKWSLYNQNLKPFGLTTADFYVGLEIAFNLPDFGVVGNFVVVERLLQPFTTENVADNLFSTLKLQNRNFLRSYGESFNRLERQLASVSVRADEIIVQSLSVSDTITMSEKIIFEYPLVHFPSTNSDIFEPLGFSGDGRVFPI